MIGKLLKIIGAGVVFCVFVTIVAAIVSPSKSAMVPRVAENVPAVTQSVAKLVQTEVLPTQMPARTNAPSPTTKPIRTRTPTQLPDPTKTPNPPEYDLAIINAGGYVSADDKTVARFRYLIAEIAAKTNNTPREIADLTAQGRIVLQEKTGREVNLLEFMEAANIAIPDDSKQKFDYKDIVIGLLVIMAK